MVERRVSVRLAAIGGQQVKNELADIGREGSRALNQVADGGRRLGGSIQNAAYQVQDFAVQVAYGTSASQALAQNLPQLLGGMGILGAVAGAAVAVFVPLAVAMFSTSDAAAKLVDEMVGAGGSISAVEGAVSALEAVQRTYNDTIGQTGGASSAAASLVLSNSAREFEARKQVLAVELELLRIRQNERTEGAANLQDAINREFDAFEIRRTEIADKFDYSRDYPIQQVPGYARGNDVGMEAEFAKATELDRLALRKLKAEMELNNLTIEQTEKMLGTTFESIAAGADTVTTSAGRAGGAIRKAAEEAVPPLEETHTAIDQIVAALGAYAEQASDFGTQIGDALTGAFQAAENAVGDFVRTGKLDVRSLVVSILADLAQLSIRNAVLGPLAQGLSGALGGGGFIGQIGKVLAGKFHSGGKVGLGTPTSVSAAAFMSAPRFHMGGGFGLRSDEQAAILQRGERVLNRDQTRAWEGGAGASIVINTRDAQSFRQSRAQVASDIARAVSFGRRSL